MSRSRPQEIGMQKDSARYAETSWSHVNSEWRGDYTNAAHCGNQISTSFGSLVFIQFRWVEVDYGVN